MTWQLGVIIGVSTIKIFVLFVNPTFLRIAGPFQTPPLPKFRVFPLGVVPKKVPGEFRVIHHLSYPKGLSLNDGIPHEYSSVSYANIEDAIRFIKKAGHGCFLPKTDVQSAFCIIPMNPKD